MKGTFEKEDIDEIISRRVIPRQQSLMDNEDNKNIVSCVEKYNNSVIDSEDNLSPSDKLEEGETEEENLSPSDKLEEEETEGENLSPSDKWEEIESSENTIESKFPVTGTSDGDDLYGVDTVENLIEQYEGYVSHPVSNKINRKNRCVLDALYLLRDRMKCGVR